MSSSVLSALLLVLVVAAVSVWVLEDAQAQLERGRPVVATLGELTIDRPNVWAALCLLALVLFLPLYLVARRAG
ncbi:hypothetical protein [Terrabacter sp. BE26]|uniref:hypothetical protein n=1 Tax=Terrabacter sp. BE26 TaxID=2898152 RepID=UPI0035BE3AB0